MKKKYYYREKKYKYVEDYEMVSINEGRARCFLFWFRRQSETGCTKSTSNTGFVPQLWGNFVLRAAHFYFRAVVGRSTRKKYCCVSWATTLREGSVCSRTCAPTASLFWVAVLGSCLPQAADSSAAFKSPQSLWRFLLLQANTAPGQVFSETRLLMASSTPLQELKDPSGQ